MWGQRTAISGPRWRVRALVVPSTAVRATGRRRNAPGRTRPRPALRASGVPCRWSGSAAITTSTPSTGRAPRKRLLASIEMASSPGRCRREARRPAANSHDQWARRDDAHDGPRHRTVLDRLGERPVSAVLLDTPYGFQENADDISDRALDYFPRQRRNPSPSPPSVPADVDVLIRETAQVRIREARPGLRRARQPNVRAPAMDRHGDTEAVGREARAGRRRHDGERRGPDAGPLHDPVYEIYKVGEAPRWLSG